MCGEWRQDELRGTDRKRLDYLEESLGRNTHAKCNVGEGKAVSGEDSEKNEKHLIGSWKKGDACYKGTENLTELGSTLG